MVSCREDIMFAVLKKHCINAIIVFCLLAVAGSALADDALSSAKQYLATGKYRAALIELKNAAQASPDDAGIRLFLGKTYLELGDAVAAEKELRKAMTLDPGSKLAQLPLGKALLWQGKYADVLRDIKVKPEYSAADKQEALRLRALAYLYTKRFELATDEINKADDLGRNAADVEIVKARIAAAQGDIDKALAIVNPVVAAHKTDTQALVLQGSLLRRKGDYSAALTSYTTAHATAPGNISILLDKVMMLMANNRQKEAGKAIDGIDKRYRELPATQYVMGLFAMGQGRFADAQGNFERVVRVAPKHYPSILMLGVVNYQQKNYESARNYLETYTTAYPKNLRVQRLLGITDLRLGHADDALSAFLKIEKSGVKDGQLLALIGSSYMYKKDYAKANEYLEEAVKVAPGLASIRAQVAISNLATGDSSGAIRNMRSAVDMGGDLIAADAMLVKMYMLRGKTDEAIKSANSFAKKKPGSPLPPNLLGMAYLQKRDLAKAKLYFEQALTKDPNFVPASVNIGRLYELQNKPDSARDTYLGILKQHENNLLALLSLAQLELKLRKFPSAIDYLSRARDAHPDSIQAGLLLSGLLVHQGQPLRALEVARSIASRHPGDVGVLMNLGRTQLLAGEKFNAIATFRKVYETEPDNELVALALAESYMENKDAGQAKKVLSGYLQKHQSLRASVMLARINLNQGDTEEALKIAREIQKAHSASPVGYRLEGDIQYANKHYRQALGLYEKSMKLFPAREVAIQVYRSRMQLNDTHAADTLVDWLKHNPADNGVRLLMAQIQQGKGDSAAAIASYEKVLETAPDEKIALNNLAWIYFEKNDPRAVDIAVRAHMAAPDDYAVLDTYGWIILHNGKLEEGYRYIKQAASKAPHVAQVQYHLAVALHMNGKDAEAKSEIERLLNSNRPFPERDSAKALLNKL